MSHDVSAAFRAAILGNLQAPVARMSVLWPDLSPRRVYEIDESIVLAPTTVGMDRKRTIRRQCQATLANPRGIWTPRGLGDLFASGSIVRFERGFVIGNNPELVPLITAVVEAPKASSATAQLSFSALDRLSLADTIFGDVVSYDTGTPVATVIQQNFARTPLGSLFLEMDDGGGVLGAPRSYAPEDNVVEMNMSLARDFALDLFAHALGLPVLRPIRDPNTLPIARRFDRTPDTKMLDIDRTQTAKPYNRTIVISERPDQPPVRGEARVTDSDSPLHESKIGPRVYPPRRTAQVYEPAQAHAAALADLYQVALVEDAVGASAVSDPTLEEADAVFFGDSSVGADDIYLLDTITQPVLEGAMPMTSTKIRPLLAAP